MEVFSAAPHDEIVLLLFQLGILLLSARLLGELAQRLGQPSVVGEILAGIVLGPSILSSLFPGFGELIIPQTESAGYLLELISLIGAMFLLLITGMETDIKLIKRHAKTAISVSYGGIIVTFATGFLLGLYLPDFLLADADQRIIFALFVGTAMSISAIPVIAKVLMDMNLVRRDIGQTIIAAGMSDDTNGWIMLSIVAGLASGAAITLGSVAFIIGSVLAFMVFSFTLGRLLVKKVLNFVQDEVISSNAILSVIIIFMFIWGSITHALNLEAVLGAFVMGILVGQLPRIPRHVHRSLHTMALAVFAPIFFAVAGLKVNVLDLLSLEMIGIALLIIAIATLGKVAGTYLGARLIGGKDHWTALSFGAGLNARGAMEIIIATIGLSLGVLSQEMFSIIVIMAMVTSLMAPFALKWTLSKVQMDDQEQARLKREEMESRSFIASVHRVLLPIRYRENISKGSIQTIESVILERMGSNTELSVTLLTVCEQSEKARSQAFLSEIATRFNKCEIVEKVAISDKPEKAILDELSKDYELLLLGATERTEGSDTLFNPMVDELIRSAPCPTLVIHGTNISPEWNPHRILIPTNGSSASKRAADIGFYIASSDARQQMIVLNVVEQEEGDAAQKLHEDRVENRKYHMSRQFVEDIKKIGDSYDIETQAMVEMSAQVEASISRVAKDNSIDLIVIGTSVRPGSARLFIGPKVERLLNQAPCPVIVYND